MAARQPWRSYMRFQMPPASVFLKMKDSTLAGSQRFFSQDIRGRKGLFNRLRQTLAVNAVDTPSGIGDDLFHGADGKRNDRRSAGHGFDIDKAESLIQGRIDQQIGHSVEFIHFFPV